MTTQINCYKDYSSKAGLYCCIVIIICYLFNTTARNKDSEDNKKEPGDGKEQLKTALGRRASGVTTKMSKPGEQVCNGQLVADRKG